MCWLLPFSTWLTLVLSVVVPVSHDDDSEIPLLLCSLLSSGLPLLLCVELNACISHFCSCLISSWWSWRKMRYKIAMRKETRSKKNRNNESNAGKCFISDFAIRPKFLNLNEFLVAAECVQMQINFQAFCIERIEATLHRDGILSELKVYHLRYEHQYGCIILHQQKKCFSWSRTFWFVNSRLEIEIKRNLYIQDAHRIHIKLSFSLFLREQNKTFNNADRVVSYETSNP